MKTTALRAWMVVCLSALAPTATSRASADQAATAAKHEKTYTGTVVSVDPQEHVLKVKEFWLMNKAFNLGSDCSYTFLDNRAGSMNDLHSGQKVTVSYRDAEGVLVADQVVQDPLRCEGTVKKMDPESHTLTVHLHAFDKKFRIADDCNVILHDDKPGTLANVQPGNRVTITYETPNGIPTAQQIAQTSAVFTGALTAIDLNERTVKAKSLFGTKKFNLADRCTILVNGKAEGQMRDLKPGDKLTLSYDDVNGVNVANRIADAGRTSEAMTAHK